MPVYRYCVSSRTRVGSGAGMGRPPTILVAVDEPTNGSARATTSTSGTSDDPAVGTLPEQLFFIHGWPDDASLWDAQAAYFSQRGYRCLRVSMPHYGGRDDAAAAGDLAADTGFLPDCNWSAMCPRLAEAVRENCSGRPVTLVIHDWGSVWGFYLQQYAPELVKAVSGTSDSIDYARALDASRVP